MAVSRAPARRAFGLSARAQSPSPLLAVSLVAALPVALWTYKCMMLVVFQRSIIYMGYVPPGARAETLAKDVPSSHLRGVECEEITISTEEHIQLAGLVVRRRGQSSTPKTVLMYLQGNAGSPLHRLPVFQKLLEATTRDPIPTHNDLAILAVAPRSYWSSSSHTPTQKGILSDYRQALQYTLERFPGTNVILYGHSLGGAAAVCLLSSLSDDGRHSQYSTISGLILENPFASIPRMVRALYPDKWVPYHYLAPLAIDKWEAVEAMRTACDEVTPPSLLTRLSRNTLVLLSEKDEVVPNEMGHELFDIASRGSSLESDAREVVVRDALHENTWQQRQWLLEVTRYIAGRSTLSTLINTEQGG